MASKTGCERRRSSHLKNTPEAVEADAGRTFRIPDEIQVDWTFESFDLMGRSLKREHGSAIIPRSR
jgi:hypothetical protein